MRGLKQLDLKQLTPADNRDLTVPSIFGYTAASWTEALSNLGPVVQLHINAQPCIVISSMAANQQAWRNPAQWSYRDTDFSNIFRTQLGPDHVTILDGEPHRRLRKLILPGFGAAAMRRDVQTTCTTFAQNIERQAGSTVDLYRLACTTMADALTRTQIKTPITAAQRYDLCGFEEEFIAALQLSPPDQAHWFARPAYQKARDSAFAFFNQVLNARLRGHREDDSLDIILQRSAHSEFTPLSRTEIIESIYLLSIAGVGNIAHLLCTMLWKVAGTRWQGEARRQLRNVDLARLDGMKGLPLLKALINETERLFPPAPVIPKRTTQDIELLGQQIPRGSLVLHLHTLSHYDPATYPSPFEFQPQRWLEGSPARTNAFGGGKHLCLGMGVTRALLPLLAGLLLRDYQLDLPEPPQTRIIDADFGSVPVSTAMRVTLQRTAD
ncbi:MAG: cytochrome P450 [bacterium]